MGEFYLTIRVFFALLAVAAALTAISGCGSSSSDAASTGGVTVETGSLSKAEFIKKADAVCEEFQEKSAKRLVGYARENHMDLSSALSDAAKAALFEGVFVPIYRNQLAQISELGAPEEDVDEIAAILETAEAEIAKGQRDPSATLASNELIPKAAALARKYGLVVCGTLWT